VEDVDRCKKLLNFPLHASPFEHQGSPIGAEGVLHIGGHYLLRPEVYQGNLKGFVQFRKFIPGEYLA
jgi:hypothetical protein